MIQDRFRPTQEGTTYEQFLALRQEATVDEYRRQFELLAASLVDIPDPIQEENFINGLKSEIRADVRMAQPKGLGRIVDLAKRVEERNEMLCKPRGPHPAQGCAPVPGLHPNLTVQASSWNRTPQPFEKPTGNRSDPNNSISFRRLFETEYQAKRERAVF